MVKNTGSKETHLRIKETYSKRKTDLLKELVKSVILKQRLRRDVVNIQTFRNKVEVKPSVKVIHFLKSNCPKIKNTKDYVISTTSLQKNERNKEKRDLGKF